MRQTKLDEYPAFRRFIRWFPKDKQRLDEYQQAREEIEDEERRARWERFD